MARDPEPTRRALIGAAERLFATQGIDRVSLREVSRASGARNTVALQYHFKDRGGVVQAVITKHYPDIDRRRHALLDAYESLGTPDIRKLSAALVLPSAAKLADPDGGPQYLQIHAELVNRPRETHDPGYGRTGLTSVRRWRELVTPFLGQDAARLHRRFTAIRFCATELGLRARGAPHKDDRLFVSQLVDQVAALLLAPVSSQTSTLVVERDRAMLAHSS